MSAGRNTPTGGGPRDWACDAGVAIASLVSNHDAHEAMRAVVLERRPALAGPAVVQAYTALTRLPLPDRVRPEVAIDVLRRAFPVWLDRQRTTTDALEAIARAGLGGTAVADGMVGLAAAYVGATLLTRDPRAARTYDTLGIPYELLEP